MNETVPTVNFRNSVWRFLLQISWLWIGSLLAVSGVWEAPVLARMAGWMFAVGAPLALVAVATSSVRVAGDRVVVKDVRGTVVYARGEAILRVRNHAGLVGSLTVLEFAAPGEKTKAFSTGFMAKGSRKELIRSVRAALRSDRGDVGAGSA